MDDEEYLQALEFVNKIENIMLKDKGAIEELYQEYEYFLKVAYQGLARIMYFYPGRIQGPEVLFYVFYAGYMAGQGHGIDNLIELDKDIWGDVFEEE